MRFIQSPSMFGHNLSRHTLKGESLREESGMSSDETESSSFSSDDDDNDEGIGARPMSVTDIRREAATNSSPKRPDTAEIVGTPQQSGSAPRHTVI